MTSSPGISPAPTPRDLALPQQAGGMFQFVPQGPLPPCPSPANGGAGHKREVSLTPSLPSILENSGSGTTGLIETAPLSPSSVSSAQSSTAAAVMSVTAGVWQAPQPTPTPPTALNHGTASSSPLFALNGGAPLGVSSSSATVSPPISVVAPGRVARGSPNTPRSTPTFEPKAEKKASPPRSPGALSSSPSSSSAISGTSLGVAAPKDPPPSQEDVKRLQREFAKVIFSWENIQISRPTATGVVEQARFRFENRPSRITESLFSAETRRQYRFPENDWESNENLVTFLSNIRSYLRKVRISWDGMKFINLERFCREFAGQIGVTCLQDGRPESYDKKQVIGVLEYLGCISREVASRFKVTHLPTNVMYLQFIPYSTEGHLESSSGRFLRMIRDLAWFHLYYKNEKIVVFEGGCLIAEELRSSIQDAFENQDELSSEELGLIKKSLAEGFFNPRLSLDGKIFQGYVDFIEKNKSDCRLVHSKDPSKIEELKSLMEVLDWLGVVSLTREYAELRQLFDQVQQMGQEELWGDLSEIDRRRVLFRIGHRSLLGSPGRVFSDYVNERINAWKDEHKASLAIMNQRVLDLLAYVLELRLSLDGINFFGIIHFLSKYKCYLISSNGPRTSRDGSSLSNLFGQLGLPMPDTKPRDLISIEELRESLKWICQQKNSTFVVLQENNREPLASNRSSSSAPKLQGSQVSSSSDGNRNNETLVVPSYLKVQVRVHDRVDGTGRLFSEELIKEIGAIESLKSAHGSILRDLWYKILAHVSAIELKWEGQPDFLPLRTCIVGNKNLRFRVEVLDENRPASQFLSLEWLEEHTRLPLLPIRESSVRMSNGLVVHSTSSRGNDPAPMIEKFIFWIEALYNIRDEIVTYNGKQVVTGFVEDAGAKGVPKVTNNLSGRWMSPETATLIEALRSQIHSGVKKLPSPISVIDAVRNNLEQLQICFLAKWSPWTYHVPLHRADRDGKVYLGGMDGENRLVEVRGNEKQQTHLIPRGYVLRVKTGDEVKKGDFLAEGLMLGKGRDFTLEKLFKEIYLPTDTFDVTTLASQFFYGSQSGLIASILEQNQKTRTSLAGTHSSASSSTSSATSSTSAGIAAPFLGMSTALVPTGSPHKPPSNSTASASSNTSSASSSPSIGAITSSPGAPAVAVPVSASSPSAANVPRVFSPSSSSALGGSNGIKDATGGASVTNSPQAETSSIGSGASSISKVSTAEIVIAGVSSSSSLSTSASVTSNSASMREPSRTSSASSSTSAGANGRGSDGTTSVGVVGGVAVHAGFPGPSVRSPSIASSNTSSPSSSSSQGGTLAKFRSLFSRSPNPPPPQPNANPTTDGIWKKFKRLFGSSPHNPPQKDLILDQGYATYELSVRPSTVSSSSSSANISETISSSGVTTTALAPAIASIPSVNSTASTSFTIASANLSKAVLPSGAPTTLAPAMFSGPSVNSAVNSSSTMTPQTGSLIIDRNSGALPLSLGGALPAVSLTGPSPSVGSSTASPLLGGPVAVKSTLTTPKNDRDFFLLAQGFCNQMLWRKDSTNSPQLMEFQLYNKQLLAKEGRFMSDAVLDSLRQTNESWDRLSGEAQRIKKVELLEYFLTLQAGSKGTAVAPFFSFLDELENFTLTGPSKDKDRSTDDFQSLLYWLLEPTYLNTSAKPEEDRWDLLRRHRQGRLVLQQLESTEARWTVYTRRWGEVDEQGFLFPEGLREQLEKPQSDERKNELMEDILLAFAVMEVGISEGPAPDNFLPLRAFLVQHRLNLQTVVEEGTRRTVQQDFSWLERATGLPLWGRASAQGIDSNNLIVASMWNSTLPSEPTVSGTVTTGASSFSLVTSTASSSLSSAPSISAAGMQLSSLGSSPSNTGAVSQKAQVASTEAAPSVQAAPSSESTDLDAGLLAYQKAQTTASPMSSLSRAVQESSSVGQGSAATSTTSLVSSMSEKKMRIKEKEKAEQAKLHQALMLQFQAMQTERLRQAKEQMQQRTEAFMNSLASEFGPSSSPSPGTGMSATASVSASSSSLQPTTSSASSSDVSHSSHSAATSSSNVHSSTSSASSSGTTASSQRAGEEVNAIVPITPTSTEVSDSTSIRAAKTPSVLASVLVAPTPNFMRSTQSRRAQTTALRSRDPSPAKPKKPTSKK